MTSALCITMSTSRVLCPSAHGQYLNRVGQCLHELSAQSITTRCCGESVPYMHFNRRQRRSVSRGCGGFTYVSVRASAYLFARLASSTMSCRRLRVFVFVAADADHVSHECQQWCPCEVAVGSLLLDFTRGFSTPYFHTFIGTLDDAVPPDMLSRLSPFQTPTSPSARFLKRQLLSVLDRIRRASSWPARSLSRCANSSGNGSVLAAVLVRA